MQTNKPSKETILDRIISYNKRLKLYYNKRKKVYSIYLIKYENGKEIETPKLKLTSSKQLALDAFIFIYDHCIRVEV
jgi:hypothetical protein